MQAPERGLTWTHFYRFSKALPGILSQILHRFPSVHRGRNAPVNVPTSRRPCGSPPLVKHARIAPILKWSCVLSLSRSSFSFAAGTVLSRVIGLLRESVI